MPKPSNTIGDRDSGKRLYVGNQPYQVQVRRRTIAGYDRIWKTKHSESKKPYWPDQTYPDMEYQFDPWNPVFPPHEPPPWGPNDPTDPPVDGPPTGGNPGKQPNKWPFLGCDFMGSFNPNPVSPGELAFAQMALTPDDAIASVEVDGPVELLADISYYTSLTGEKLQAQWGSALVHFAVRAWSAEKIAADPRYNNVASGLIYFQVQVKTRSYAMSNEPGQAWSVGVCSASGTVTACPPEVALAWDDETSATTIGQNSSAIVAVLGGLPPFRWAVDGTGFSFDDTKTSSRSNLVKTSASACGTGMITVTDGCGDQVTGYIRCTEGEWLDLDSCSCPIYAASTGYEPPPPGQGLYEAIQDKWKCFEAWEQTWLIGLYGTCPGSCTDYGCSGRCLDTDLYCHEDCGCNGPCISDSYTMADGYTGRSQCAGLPYCVTQDGGAMECVCKSSGSKCQEWVCAP